MADGSARLGGDPAANQSALDRLMRQGTDNR